MLNSPSSILALGTALPRHLHEQEPFAQSIANHLQLLPDRREKLEKIFRRSAIEERYAVIETLAEAPLGMGARNAVYKREAPQLAEKAALKAIQSWGGSPQEITHVLSVSCTGMIAPGIESLLISRLGLPSDTYRLGINFMGCFGAFAAIKTASSLIKEPHHRALVVCTELCSLHFQWGDSEEHFVSNALFADGSAAAIVGPEAGLWQIVDHRAQILPNTAEEMTWEAGDAGYLMHLSENIPLEIHQHIKRFAREVAGDIPFEDMDWPVHPGGKAVLHAVQKGCGLKPEQLAASRSVLKRCGNLSSATFLFVLEALAQQKTRKEWAIGLGFGPGLALEGILLRR